LRFVVSTNSSFIISILAERSATVFYNEAADHPLQYGLYGSALTTSTLPLGQMKGQINVVENFLFFPECAHLIEISQIWEIGRRRVRAIFKHESLSNLSTSLLMAVSLFPPLTTIQFVCGAYVMAQKEHCRTEPTPHVSCI
jgi:hypothetical protein